MAECTWIRPCSALTPSSMATNGHRGPAVPTGRRPGRPPRRPGGRSADRRRASLVGPRNCRMWLWTSNSGLCFGARTRPKFASMAKRASCDIISRSNSGHGKCGAAGRYWSCRTAGRPASRSVDAQLVAERLGKPLPSQFQLRIGIGQRRVRLDNLLHHRGHLTAAQRRMGRGDVVGRAVELRAGRGCAPSRPRPNRPARSSSGPALDPQAATSSSARRGAAGNLADHRMGKLQGGVKAVVGASCIRSANRRR